MLNLNVGYFHTLCGWEPFEFSVLIMVASTPLVSHKLSGMKGPWQAGLEGGEGFYGIEAECDPEMTLYNTFWRTVI